MPTTIPRPMLSVHALRRCAEMGISKAVVLAVLSNPEVDYPSDPARYGEGTRVAVRGDLAVCYNERTGIVVTVVFHLIDQWERSQVMAQKGTTRAS